MSCCPHCGYNLTRDEVVHVGDWRLDPRGTVAYKGEDLMIRGSLAVVMHTLASNEGRVVSGEVIEDRCGSVSDSHTGRVHVSRLRRLLRERGIPNPVHTVWGHGYRWKG